jgi:hypothetical protein
MKVLNEGSEETDHPSGKPHDTDSKENQHYSIKPLSPLYSHQVSQIYVIKNVSI